MSLDDRLRLDLREIAATVEPETDAALRAVLARRTKPSRVRTLAPRIAAGAAAVLLVGAVVVWRVGGGHGSEPDVVKDPPPPSGTYEATLPGDLSGDLAGDWTLRVDRNDLSVTAPGPEALGTRTASAPYDVRGGVLTTDLLAGACPAPGSYTWTQEGSGLTFSVENDDCDLRVRLLTTSTWSPVSGAPLAEGTYQTPALTVDQLKEAALAAGLAETDVDAELSLFGDAQAITFTLQIGNGTWTEFETVDDTPPSIQWSGPYVVVDAGTVVAGEPPCGPITYDYRLDGDQLSLVVLDDACREGAGDTVPVGELIAQTVIYQTAPFTRVGR